ncbi:MAG: hypothetical protein OES79_11425 [Planctomycetota bacterium]|nr:hypothetical protein [Planctomycetota bacterium]
MAARSTPPYYRVGRISYFQHHCGWYLDFKEDDHPVVRMSVPAGPRPNGTRRSRTSS